MPAVLDRLKSTVYTSVGINLLIADAIVGREVATPKFATDGDITARQQATDALTGFRSRTAPTTEKLIGKLPDSISDTVGKRQRAVWNRLGIDEPGSESDATSTATDTDLSNQSSTATETNPTATDTDLSSQSGTATETNPTDSDASTPTVADTDSTSEDVAASDQAETDIDNTSTTSKVTATGNDG